jgi:hypothetical protein
MPVVSVSRCPWNECQCYPWPYGGGEKTDAILGFFCLETLHLVNRLSRACIACPQYFQEEYTARLQTTVESAASDLEAASTRHAEAMAAAATTHANQMEAAAAEAAALLRVERAAVANLEGSLGATKAEEARLRWVTCVLSGRQISLSRSSTEEKHLWRDM